uniref:Quaternary ammonium compound-resistance protein SugE n=1 Tax=Thermosporothrix sp. COM3 TaxID=2490863 RepID=A0A455SGK3_9CHLR|nr:quaternary ammonium compound-resistance protein SugE [Thermosporothrix sp. COM3]
MAWIILIIAGLFEIVWAVALKESAGFSKLVPSIITVIGMAISVWLLALAIRSLPVGTGYAVWTGIGALGTAIIGILFLHESTSIPRLIFLALLIISLIGLKLSTPEG